MKEFETVKYVASNATTKSVKIELFDGDVASTINSSLYPSETFAGGWSVSYTHLDVYKRQSRYRAT